MKTKVEKFLNSNYFILTICAILFLGWLLKLVEISYIALCVFGCLVFLTCKNLTPVALLLCLAPCCKFEGFKFSSKLVYVLIPFAVALVGCLFWYIIKNFIKEKKKIKPGSLWLGMALAFIACLFGGAFSPDFSVSHMFAATGIVVLSYFVYVLLLNSTGEELKEYVYKIVLAIVLLGTLECGVYFARSSLPMIDVIKGKFLNIGWATSNGISTVFSLLAPLCLYQSINSKRPWLEYLLFFVSVILSIITLARRTLLVLIIFVPIMLVYTFLRTENKNKMLKWFIIYLSALFFVCLLFYAEIHELYSFMNNNYGTNLNGREELWNYCIAEFKKYPAFGIGFFGEDMSGLNYPARLLHNTPLQIICCTGIIGTVLFIPFFYQRYKLLIKNISLFKVFALFFVLMWEVGGLLDVNFVKVNQLVIIYTLLASCENEAQKQPAWLTFNKNKPIMNK